MTVYTKKISTRGRINIPPEVRQQLNLQHGDRAEIVLDNGDWVLRKVQGNGSILSQSDKLVPVKKAAKSIPPG